MKQKELIAEYFISQLTQQEEQVRDLQQRVRHRRIDVNDSYYSLPKIANKTNTHKPTFPLKKRNCCNYKQQFL